MTISAKRVPLSVYLIEYLIDPDQPRPLVGPGPEVIKLCSCSTQLSTKFQLLIKTIIPTNEGDSSFKSLRCLSLSDVVLIMLINVKMTTIVGILTFMSRINFVLS